MSTAPKIFGKPQAETLGLIGTALLQVKNERRLTLKDMELVLGKIDDMVAKYIAGDTEMPVTAWLRANEAWPELIDKLNELAAKLA